MITFPNCKINIGLQVLGKRADGFHDLQTLFYPVALRDVLEIIDAPKENSMEFSSSGIPVSGEPENNLCYKAYGLIKKDFPALPGMKMHLHKVIPMGAGLGGGSADAAFCLSMINDKYKLGLSLQQLMGYALQLGSDCPYFLINSACLATGRGEILKETALDLSSYKILVVHPGIHINTGWAFSMLDKKRDGITDFNAITSMPVSEWRGQVHNDFEPAVFGAYPEIRSVKDAIYLSGALYASMSGSGSSVYGIFQKDQFPELDFPAHYFYRWV